MPFNQTESDFFSGDTSNKSSMSWTIEHVKESRFVRVIVTGVYNIDDHMRLLKDVVARDFWKPGMNLLIDDSNLDFRRTSLEQLREAAVRRVGIDSLIGGGKTAVVVDTLADFARVRQYELITSGKVSAKMEVFKDENKAVRWLLA